MNSSYTTPPGCQPPEYFLVEKRLQQLSLSTQAFLIFIIIINILACPFTAVLNALVMIAVKTKSRLRAHKSNMLLALLALTDFVVGVVIQPAFVVVIILFLLEEPSGYCLLRFFMLVLSCLVKTSVFHLALISGERYVAMKHPFSYITIVTESRLLVCSALVWLLSITVQILIFSDGTLLVHINIALISLSIAFIVFCHIIVYRETRRHEQQLAAEQVTQEAREQFEKDKKALKLTSTILGVLLLCFMPLYAFVIIVTIKYGSKITLVAIYVFFIFTISMTLLNSLLNPIIYSIRMRQFRVAFVELMCRTVNIAEAEEIEMGLFRAPNATVTLEAAQEHERQDQQNMEQANMNSGDNYNNDVQRENYVAEQLNNNSYICRFYYRHSI